MESISDELAIRACKDLQARTKNFGSWPNGIPESFQEIRELRLISKEDPLWVHTVETIVRNEAIRLAAERLT